MLVSPFVVMTLRGHIGMPMRRMVEILGNGRSNTEQAFRMSYAFLLCVISAAGKGD